MTQRNQHEREFEAFLAGEESELARLYRRLPQSEPDPKLDAAVLAMARAAVEPQRVNALRHAKVRPKRPLWLVGLSSAAGLVLAAGVAWQMRSGFHDSPARTLSAPPAAQSEREVIPVAILPDAPMPAEVAADTAAAPAPPPPPAEPARPQAGAGMTQPRAAAARPESMAAKAQPAPRKLEQVPEPPAPAPPPAPALARESAAPVVAEPAPAAAGADKDARFAEERERAAAPGGRAQPFPQTAPDHNSVERKAAIATGSRREEFGLSAGSAAEGQRLRQDAQAARSEAAAPQRVDDALAANASPAAAQAAPSAAPKPVLAEATATPADAGTAETAVATAPAPASPAARDAAGIGLTRKAPANTSVAGATRAPAATAAPAEADAESAKADASAEESSARHKRKPLAAADQAELERNTRLAPEVWLQRIRALLEQDRREAALANLERLRERHPQWPIPEDLRDLR